MYYAFTASHPERAARELRDHPYDACAVMMMDRRRRHRHTIKGSAREQKWEPKPIVAHKGYWRHLDRQGYRFRGFERWVERRLGQQHHDVLVDLRRRDRPQRLHGLRSDLRLRVSG